MYGDSRRSPSRNNPEKVIAHLRGAADTTKLEEVLTLTDSGVAAHNCLSLHRYQHNTETVYHLRILH